MRRRRSRHASPWARSEEGETRTAASEDSKQRGIRNKFADGRWLRLYSFIGFLLGSTLAASGSYFYVLQDYKTSNALLTEDIYVRFCI